MLKETIIFAASTGLLIYAITPSEEPSEVQPVAVEKQEILQPVEPVAEDSWEDEAAEEEEDYENFVFGEPMTIAGSGSDDPWEEDDSTNLRFQADKSSSKNPASGNSAPPEVMRPRPGEPGSRQNPIERNGSAGSAGTGSIDY